jgi:hypothetical protein
MDCTERRDAVDAVVSSGVYSARHYDEDVLARASATEAVGVEQQPSS